MRGNRIPVVIGTSISSLTSNATWRSIFNSAARARTWAFQPESVRIPARRTSCAILIAMSRHRTRKKSAPAIHNPSRNWGKYADNTLKDVLGADSLLTACGKTTALDVGGAAAATLGAAGVMRLA